jgi:parallel beta-helix repeat protein
LEHLPIEFLEEISAQVADSDSGSEDTVRSEVVRELVNPREEPSLVGTGIKEHVLDPRGCNLPRLEAPAAPDRNVVSHNVANSKVSDGILVNGDATATLLERNTADGNGDDGIDVDAAGTTVTANTANHNQDLGIEAVFGVIDGGGNKASGNGNPAQCTNVTCK